MSHPFYVSPATVTKVNGAHRRALLEGGTTPELAVHGAVKRHCRSDSEPDLPLPVDYLVVAAAG